MLAIDLMRRVRRLPLLVLIGLLLMAVGGVLDVMLHLGPVSHHGHEPFGSEHVAHLVGIAGMVLVLAGVVTHGARRRARQRATRSNGGFDRNAHR